MTAIKKRKPDLFHVTQRWKVDEILKHGLSPYYPSAELSPMVEAYKEQTGKSVMDDIDDFYDYIGKYDFESTSEVLARDKLNELLPMHDDSMFFWTDEERASEIHAIVNERGFADYIVVGIDSQALPDKVYVADYDISDEMFGILEELYSPPFTDEDEEYEVMEELEKLAKEYEKSIKIFDGTVDYNMEALYQGRVPLEAIRTVDGKPISLTDTQARLYSFESRGRGRGWWGEPLKHKMAGMGIKTVYRRRSK